MTAVSEPGAQAAPDREAAAPRRGARRRGNRLGFLCFESAVRLCGLRGAYGLLYIVCAWYLLCDRPAVRAGLAYIRRRFPAASRLGRLALVYRLFISQGRILIDRHCLVAGRGAFEFEFRGHDRIASLLQDPSRGFVLLTAHVGNWQVVLEAVRRFQRPVGLLMRPEDNPAAQASLAVGRESAVVRIISPDSFLGGVVELMGLLRQGYVVSLMGDRSYGFNAVEVPFLGQPARLPYSAFHIAAAAECPVVVLLSAKVATRRYVVEAAEVMHPRYAQGLPKRDQARAWAGQFARVLEAYTARFPLQCFLFRDVWREKAGE